MRMNRPSAQLSFGGPFDAELKHRLFFAIRLGADATESLTRLMVRLCDDGTIPVRPVDADRLHATLHHLGDFADQIPPSLVPTARAAAATIKMQPFEVTFDRIVGTNGRLLLLISDGSAALREFRQTLSAALIEAGLHRHVTSTFSPHVTLSYDVSDAPEQRVEPIIWIVRQFVLIESLLGKHHHLERGCWSIQG